jgi:Transglutaminase-like superfamily
MRRIRLFLSMDSTTKLLLVEAFIELGVARIMKLFPFSKLTPHLGCQMEETPFTKQVNNQKALKSISNAVNIMSRYTVWESQCLVKAIAAMRMLERRKIESTLYLGTGKDEKGLLIAHAWLRSGSIYLTGSEGMEKFTVVGTFAKHSKLTNEGESIDKRYQS